MTTVKTFYLFILFILFSSTGISQDLSKICYGVNTNYLNCLYTIDNEHIYKGNSTNYLDIIYTYEDDAVYNGKVPNYIDIKYNVNRKDSVITNKNNVQLYLLKDNKIFNGLNTNLSNCMFTVKDLHVYQGNSTSTADIIYTLDKKVDLFLLAYLLGGY